VIPDKDEDSDIEKSKIKSNRRMEQTLNVLLQEVAEEKRGEAKRKSQDRQSDSKILGSQKRRSVESAHYSSNNSCQGSRIARLLLPRPYDVNENEEKIVVIEVQDKQNEGERTWPGAKNKKDNTPFQIDATTVDEYITILSTEKNVQPYCVH
jgi:hypothetical protein